ncbi:MAG: bifunctional 2-polyprenyl-6-hydroxyphenol methylase/3-demethylubiquinol 3-O-methyltransferase UbiG [Alphaproteobacteria bacterium]|nr:bifunctional 2-polyprenyl-6-hydroxyphenol methylase/3-demethylubiquinol 3-O-methyltransferase UbiG [Alphaproteobacteria bacterium]
MASTANAREIHNFTSLATQWWNEDGPMKPLHALNPTRMGIVKRWLGGDLKGMRILDVGCGGGIVCEPLARMGATVTGIDAGAENIEAAKAHAAESGLKIKYECTTAEDHAGQYDAVLALEIVEHVDDPALFLENIVRLCKPNGTIIVSTLNRTPKSFALGIVAAEYILRWVPRGTHTWSKFKKPSELAAMMTGTKVTNMTGLVYDPLRGAFAENSRDVDVNYFLCARKSGR